MRRWALGLWLTACVDPVVPSGPDVAGPLDDVLRVNHLQAVGTHNSYHSAPGFGRPEWDYAHPPLWEQGLLGVRQFELDLAWSEERDAYDVFHIPIVDMETSCATLRGCLWAQRVWSDSRPGHHPILTLLEVKDRPPDDPSEVQRRLDELAAAVLDVWPRDRLITPDDLRGDAATVRDAVRGVGWPVLAGLRGRAIYVLHSRSMVDRLTGGEDVPGGVLVPDAFGNTSRPYAAFHSMNDPFDPRIPEVVAQGFLVRTRADADGFEARANDVTRRDQALASGAQFVSTDWPTPHPDTGYVVVMPGGTPSRCNPVSAPAACTSQAIEDVR